MAGELRQYDPLQVVGSFSHIGGSVDIVDGAVDGGEFLAVAGDNPTWTREHDRGGNATRVKNNNTGGTISVTISASSPTNASLSALVVADGVVENVVGALVLKDLNGNTVVEADGAFVADIPDPTFGSDRGSRVWVFECAAIRTVLGGHDLA